LKTLSFGFLTVALLATPLVVTKSAEADDARSHRGANFEQFDLTEAQASQIAAVRAETRSQIEALLTPEQRSAFESSEMGPRGLRSLDLTDEQRSQIRTIREDSREQMSAILTEEQRQTLIETRSEGRGRGRSKHGSGGQERGDRLEALNLTAAQSTQIEAIRTEARSQMAALLTAEQRATLENSESGNGMTGRRAWKSLDLTDEQREQMQTIHEASHAQIDAVLTNEQRQQRSEGREGRGGRKGR